MLRDMEELLNSVFDIEIKDYMREALNCYNSGSYKACVVMSVIAGIYDLHKKVKAQANSNHKFRQLDMEVEKKKSELKPYERYLIEQCGTNDIDMLNSNEVKELIRCFETRNDCAHPSNFICSAEKARDIFSSIIDIICSKPVLFGCNSIDKIISDLEGEIFFPNLENEKVKDIVQSNIDKFHSKAIEPLLKKIANTIINTNDNTQRENAIYFLALSEKCIDNYNEDYLKEFLKDRNEIYLLRLLGINSDILNCFTDIEIERLMQRFKNCLKTMQINNLDDWIKVLLSKRIIENNYFYTTLDNLFNNENNISTILDVLIKTLDSDENIKDLKTFILTELRDNYNLIFDEIISNKNLIKFIKIMDDNEVYKQWLSYIVENLKGTTIFYKQNAILDNLFNDIPEELWINKVPKNIKIMFVKVILNLTHPQFSSPYSAKNLMKDFENKYPSLIDEFLEQLIKSNDITDLEYEWFVKNHIENNEKKNDIEKKFNYLKEKNDYELFSEEEIELDFPEL